MNESTLRAQLLRKRDEILRRIAGLSGAVGARAEPYSADTEDRAIELENLDVLFEIDAATRQELGQINRTLERIEEGSYGRCSRCGRAIGSERLRALPHAETCIDCAV